MKKKTNKIFVKSLEGNILIIIYRTNVTNTRNKKNLTKIKIIREVLITDLQKILKKTLFKKLDNQVGI